MIIIVRIKQPKTKPSLQIWIMFLGISTTRTGHFICTQDNFIIAEQELSQKQKKLKLKCENNKKTDLQ